jgi:hypothetical protein
VVNKKRIYHGRARIKTETDIYHGGTRTTTEKDRYFFAAAGEIRIQCSSVNICGGEKRYLPRRNTDNHGKR